MDQTGWVRTLYFTGDYSLVRVYPVGDVSFRENSGDDDPGETFKFTVRPVLVDHDDNDADQEDVRDAMKRVADRYAQVGMVPEVITADGVDNKFPKNLSADDIIKKEPPERTMLTVSQEHGHSSFSGFLEEDFSFSAKVGLRIEDGTGTVRRIGLNQNDDLSGAIFLTDPNQDGKITPEEAAKDIAERIEQSSHFRADKSDNTTEEEKDGVFVNIEEKNAEGPSTDLVIQDDDNNFVDIERIKVRFVVNFDTIQESEIQDNDPNTTDPDGNPNPIRIPGANGEMTLNIPGDVKDDEAVKDEADWLREPGFKRKPDGLSVDLNLNAGTIEMRTLSRTLKDNSPETFDIFFTTNFNGKAFPLGASTISISTTDANKDEVRNTSYISDVSFRDKINFVTAHEVGHHLTGFIPRGLNKADEFHLADKEFLLKNDQSNGGIKIDTRKRFPARIWAKMLFRTGPVNPDVFPFLMRLK